MPPLRSRCAYLPENFLPYAARIRMWRTIGITFKCDGGHSDNRTRRELLFQIVVLQLAIGQPKPPAVVMDHQGDMVWVVKCLRGPIERRVVKTPLGRCDLPNELRKLVAVFFVARAPAFRREVGLIPPLELRLWRQRHPVCFAAADQIPADGHHRFAAFRPQRRDDIAVRAPQSNPPRSLFDASASMNSTQSRQRHCCRCGQCRVNEARCAIPAQVRHTLGTAATTARRR